MRRVQLLFLGGVCRRGLKGGWEVVRRTRDEASTTKSA